MTPVARMNWDRARREYRAAVAYDYSERQDDLERGLVDAGRWERRPKRERATDSPVRPSGVPKAVDQLLRAHLKAESKQLGINRKELYQRRLTRYRAGQSLESIVGQFVTIPKSLSKPNFKPVAGPSGKVSVSATGRGKGTSSKKAGSPAPSTVTAKARKRQRDEAEAHRRGITVSQLQAERRAEAAHQLELSNRAKALGITTKELRKRLEDRA